MDGQEAEGFFPERKALRVRRLRAAVAPVDASETRTRRTGMGFLVPMVAPMIVTGLVFFRRVQRGPGATDVFRYALLAGLCALAVACLLAIGLVLRRALWGGGGSRAV
jgi:hypothetical protein